ncbi:3-oxoacyl-[acyl-carrier-protein] synthase II [Lentzea xinjiangensis]|uniref:3-oxoacyl-[acyl-carrier-protein] synthase II n=1 Tax=Lentzea xinjiangensis TaxID=402600 RepID=A0A1H9NJ18_9PSEU|nr:beta-ketoacyl-[acyl-carrier-protein] synthase family protein [Lentzea xinjiangensis]SER35936.1 3-oxoacyl-[acyl-carrier-protein] synthase II [Lentzea xinjiangensis]
MWPERASDHGNSGWSSSGAADLSAAGIVSGTGWGCIQSLEASHRDLLEYGPAGVQARFTPMAMNNNTPAWIAIRHGFGGPCAVTTSACCSSADALITAHHMITSGEADLVMAGGAEAPLTPHLLAGFDRLGILSRANDTPQDACRPFSSERTGTVLSEGAGFLVLESAAHATARRARPLATFAGFGRSSDAHHMLRLHPEAAGAERAITRALRSAGLRPEDVDHVNAHGTGTQGNDAHEALALGKVFGNRGSRPAVVGTKSLTGHALGAAGVLEAIAAVQAIVHNVVPPALGAAPVDPELDVDVVIGTPRETEVRAALSNSFAFGGHNAVLAFTQPGYAA